MSTVSEHVIYTVKPAKRRPMLAVEYRGNGGKWWRFTSPALTVTGTFPDTPRGRRDAIRIADNLAAGGQEARVIAMVVTA